MAQHNPFPPRKYCPRHMVTWCIEITEDCPYCMIEELEATLERVRDLAIKPMTQGGWTLDTFIKEVNTLLYPTAIKGDGDE